MEKCVKCGKNIDLSKKETKGMFNVSDENGVIVHYHHDCYMVK